MEDREVPGISGIVSDVSAKLLEVGQFAIRLWI